jgi:hypothetical protein
VSQKNVLVLLYESRNSNLIVFIADLRIIVGGSAATRA